VFANLVTVDQSAFRVANGDLPEEIEADAFVSSEQPFHVSLIPADCKLHSVPSCLEVYRLANHPQRHRYSALSAQS
jgi:hypothetical protein